MEVLTGIIIFCLGFFLGVFERKVDKIKVNKQSIKNLFSKATQERSEVLITPTEEEREKEENKEFYAKMR